MEIQHTHKEKNDQYNKVLHSSQFSYLSKYTNQNFTLKAIDFNSEDPM